MRGFLLFNPAFFPAPKHYPGSSVDRLALHWQVKKLKLTWSNRYFSTSDIRLSMPVGKSRKKI